MSFNVGYLELGKKINQMFLNAFQDHSVMYERLESENKRLLERETELLLELKESRESAVKDHYAHMNTIHDRDLYRLALEKIVSRELHSDMCQMDVHNCVSLCCVRIAKQALSPKVV